MDIIRLNLRYRPKAPFVPRTPETLSSHTEEVIASHEKESGKELGGGANYSLLIELSGGVSVVFKPFDGEARELREYVQYKRERAAYLVDRFFGFDLVPATVIREIDGMVGSAQEFITGTLNGYLAGMETEYILMPDVYKIELRLFDYIICNSDRKDDNWLLKGDRIVAIDHGLSFWEKAEPPKFDIPDELVEKVNSVLSNEDSLKLLFELLSELIPEDSISALKERLKLLAEKLNIQHEIR